MSDERRKSNQILTILIRINPHTGARFPAPRPKKQDLSVLKPSFKPWVAALSIVARLEKAFARDSKNFRIALTDITPIIGNCKLIHVSTGQEIVMEIKDKHCWIIDSETSDKSVAHLIYAIGFKQRMIFTWKVEWAYLFTIIDDEQALFIPRDQIPLSWWNNDLSSGRPEQKPILKWSTNELSSCWKEYVVRLRDSLQTVRDMETILANHQWNSLRTIPVVPLPSYAISNNWVAAASTTDGLTTEAFTIEHETAKTITNRLSLTGSPSLKTNLNHSWSRELFASHVFLEMCRAR